MTPLVISAPLTSLLVIAGMTQEGLAHACRPPRSKQAVTVAAARGDRIKLATLAAYARAAGYVLRVEARFWLGAERDKARLYSALADKLAGTVGGLRGDLAALGLEMTLAVEPAERIER